MPEKFQSAVQTRSRCVVEIEIMNVDAPTGCKVRLNPPPPRVPLSLSFNLPAKNEPDVPAQVSLSYCGFRALDCIFVFFI